MNLKKCIIVGAGNAGRPLAKLLNFAGVEVTLSDAIKYEDFVPRAQVLLDELKGEGVNLLLGVKSLDLSDYDSIYLSPTVPQSAPIRKEVENKNITLITRKIISSLVNSYLTMDKIGITGSFGKTTTTALITSIFKAAGYNVYQCTSVKQNLVSEAIIRDITKGEPENKDIAILELPHGTLGLLGEIDLKIGLITKLLPEHLCEFGGSMQKYVDRKSILLDTSETFLANCQCGDVLTYKREDTIYYNMDNKYSKDFDLEKYPPKFVGYMEDGKYYIKYEKDGKEVIDSINLDTIANYMYENLTGAIAACLTYGLSIDDVKKGVESFENVEGRMEYLGKYNQADVYFDASFGQGIRQALDSIKDKNIIAVFGSLDSTQVRDKVESGQVIGEYANTVIATGYVEITNNLDMNRSFELLDAIDNPNVSKFAVGDVDEAAIIAVKYAKPGDIIVHLGAGTSNSYNQIKEKFVKGLNEGSRIYAGEKH